MSLSLNKVMLAGNLTRDPELKAVRDSHVVAFGLAINRRFKKNDGTTGEEVVFIDVDAWGKTAEFIGQYFIKGQGIYIEGRLKLEGWETTAGEKRQRIKVVADVVQFTTQRKAADQTARTAVNSTPASGPAKTPTDDEPPF